MSNTYTQIHIHAVFAVQNRQSLILKNWKEELNKYVTGIVQNKNHKMLQINGMPDHIHLLFGMRPNQSLSELMRIIKGKSSEWINKNGFTDQPFSWQSGYGAFSYAKSELPNVIRYIINQEEHHRKKTLTEEYREILDAHGIEYDERFIFNSII